jgi:hypothetical protein
MKDYAKLLNIGPEQDKAWDKTRDKANQDQDPDQDKARDKRTENHKKEPPEDEAALQLPCIVFDLRISVMLRVRAKD